MTNEIEYKERVEALENAFEASYDGIHILDSEGRTILINKACQRIEGITKEDIGNKTISQLVEEGYYDESVTLLVLEEKRAITRLQRVKNGKEILVTAMPIYDDEGEIVRVIVNSRDVTELSELREEIQDKENRIYLYEEQLSLKDMSERVIANSKNMRTVLKTIMSVAKVNSNALITGESGTGKSFIAEMIHKNSQRKDQPFVKIDCSAIPETLFESELFGYEGGAFTGADTKGKIGLVQMADKGTIFLDEIGEMAVAMQAKLLRFIQEKKFYRVGGNEPIEIDVRIISATNRNLEEMVKERRFREDLLYRINVIPIDIPPLRERKEDIPIIIINSLKHINEKYGLNKKISEEILNIMTEYEWPGNIRELENVIERIAVISSEDNLRLEDLPIKIKHNALNAPIKKKGLDDIINSIKGSDITGGEITYKEIIDEYEHDLFETLILKGYKPLRIAEVLSMDVTTVRRKLHKYNIRFK
ncbi:MAG: sigma 54-interacting transcriptional regulator [Clostridiales bacterium]|nr:sigma 54-interacting transcriptional regulator [Clostridiales bacterium]